MTKVQKKRGREGVRTVGRREEEGHECKACMRLVRQRGQNEGGRSGHLFYTLQDRERPHM
jgi:hypothetical protein